MDLLEWLPELELNETVDRELRELLRACFPSEFESRRYLKQLPTGRFLLRSRADRSLIGHLAIDHRVVRFDETPRRIFGVVDVCVRSSHRRCGHASRLLAAAAKAAALSQADALLLFADDDRLYLRNGYTRCDVAATWFGVDEHRSLGLLARPVGEIALAKALGNCTLPLSSIDLLGTLF